jgi:hypothetical protein
MELDLGPEQEVANAAATAAAYLKQQSLTAASGGHTVLPIQQCRWCQPGIAKTKNASDQACNSYRHD